MSVKCERRAVTIPVIFGNVDVVITLERFIESCSVCGTEQPFPYQEMVISIQPDGRVREIFPPPQPDAYEKGWRYGYLGTGKAALFCPQCRTGIDAVEKENDARRDAFLAPYAAEKVGS